jgi:chromosome partitioning protein
MILAVANSKGGAGKTTAVLSIVGRLAGRCRLALVDTDPNGAASSWASDVYEGPREGLEIHAVSDAEPAAELVYTLSQRSDLDLVLIDTPGFNNATARAVIGYADAVVIASFTSRADVVEAGRTARTVRNIGRMARREIPYSTLLGRVQANTAVARHAASELYVETQEPSDPAEPLPQLQSVLSARVGFVEMTFTGVLPTSGPAAQEIDRFISELQELGWLPSITSDL